MLANVDPAIHARGDLPPTPLPLAPGEVHLVWLDTDASSPPAVPLLSPEEQSRAARFKTALDRARFTAARAALRATLSRFLCRPPASLPLHAAPAGKPALADGGLSFNLSHAGPVTLIALSATGALGVDLEDRRRPLDVATVARAHFSPPEAARLLEAPALFLQAWTRKEAVLKAIGCGLTRDLATVEAGLLATPLTWRDPETTHPWHIRTLAFAPPHTAALATSFPPHSLHLWRLPPPF